VCLAALPVTGDGHVRKGFLIPGQYCHGSDQTTG
jgi:hypothetical protein